MHTLSTEEGSIVRSACPRSSRTLVTGVRRMTFVSATIESSPSSTASPPSTSMKRRPGARNVPRNKKWVSAIPLWALGTICLLLPGWVGLRRSGRC